MTQMAYFLLFELIVFAVAINISILVIVCKTHNILRGSARKIKKGLEGSSHERTASSKISQ